MRTSPPPSGRSAPSSPADAHFDAKKRQLVEVRLAHEVDLVVRQSQRAAVARSGGLETVIGIQNALIFVVGPSRSKPARPKRRFHQ